MHFCPISSPVSSADANFSGRCSRFIASFLSLSAPPHPSQFFPSSPTSSAERTGNADGRVVEGKGER